MNEPVQGTVMLRIKACREYKPVVNTSLSRIPACREYKPGLYTSQILSEIGDQDIKIVAQNRRIRMKWSAASYDAYWESYEPRTRIAWSKPSLSRYFTSAKGLATRNFLCPCREDVDWHLYRALQIWETLKEAKSFSLFFVLFWKIAYFWALCLHHHEYESGAERKDMSLDSTEVDWIPFQKAQNFQNWPSISQDG